MAEFFYFANPFKHLFIYLFMKIGILFSGGKDSVLTAWLLKKEGHNLSCLISVWSSNDYSFMFHTPAVGLTKRQAELMGVPLIIQRTKGEKEIELKDLEIAIIEAVTKYSIKGIGVGAVASRYQKERVEKICKKLNIKCFSPLWGMDQKEILEILVKNNFEVILSGVAAYPFDKGWVGKKIDKSFIEEIVKLNEKFGVNLAGEGGEFESLVINGPIFKKKLEVKLKKVVGEGNEWRGEFE